VKKLDSISSSTNLCTDIVDFCLCLMF